MSIKGKCSALPNSTFAECGQLPLMLFFFLYRLGKERKNNHFFAKFAKKYWLSPNKVKRNFFADGFCVALYELFNLSVFFSLTLKNTSLWACFCFLRSKFYLALHVRNCSDFNFLLAMI